VEIKLVYATTELQNWNNFNPGDVALIGGETEINVLRAETYATRRFIPLDGISYYIEANRNYAEDFKPRRAQSLDEVRALGGSIDFPDKDDPSPVFRRAVDLLVAFELTVDEASEAKHKVQPDGLPSYALAVLTVAGRALTDTHSYLPACVMLFPQVDADGPSREWELWSVKKEHTHLPFGVNTLNMRPCRNLSKHDRLVFKELKFEFFRLTKNDN